MANVVDLPSPASHAFPPNAMAMESQNTTV
jgi:hypothetical protein